MIDFTRRRFLFGIAAAPLVVPARKFYLMPAFTAEPAMVEIHRTRPEMFFGHWIEEQICGVKLEHPNELDNAMSKLELRQNADGTTSVLLPADVARMSNRLIVSSIVPGENRMTIVNMKSKPIKLRLTTHE